MVLRCIKPKKNKLYNVNQYKNNRNSCMEINTQLRKLEADVSLYILLLLFQSKFCKQKKLCSFSNNFVKKLCD